jgi:chromosome partitioning protein
MAKKTKTHQLRHIVAVSNYKGGIGKTATVMNLAAAIAQRLENYRVLVIDIDSSCSLSKLLGWNLELEEKGAPTLFSSLSFQGRGLPVYPTSRKNLYLCPSSVNISGIDAIIGGRENPNSALKEVMERPLDIHVSEGDELHDTPSPTLSECFDFVIIDSQPSKSRMNYNALYAADGCIIPTELEEESINEMTKIAVAAGKIAKQTGRLSIQGILITKYDGRLRTSKFYEPKIRQMFRETFKTVIRLSKDVGESRTLHEDVFETYGGGRAAEDYTALATEYLKKYA